MTNETNLELIKDLDFSNRNDLIGWMEINYNIINPLDEAILYFSVIFNTKTGVIEIDGKPTNETLNEDRLNRLKQILE